MEKKAAKKTKTAKKTTTGSTEKVTKKIVDKPTKTTPGVMIELINWHELEEEI